MLELILATLRRILRLYRPLPGPLRKALIPLMVTGALFSSLTAIGITYIGTQASLLPGHLESSQVDAITIGFAIMEWSDSLLVLFASLVAVVWRRIGDEGVATLSFKSMAEQVRPANWSGFFLAVVFLALVHLVLAGLRFDAIVEPQLTPFDDEGYTMVLRYRQWFGEVIGFALRFLPYVIGILLLFADRKQPLLPALRGSGRAVWATLVLALAANSICNDLIGVYREYLMPVYGIVFEHSLIPLALNIAAILILGSFLFPILVVILYGPLDALEARPAIVDPAATPADPSLASDGSSGTQDPSSA